MEPRPPSPIPLNDLSRQTKSLEGELADAMRRVVESGWYVGGPEVSGFESEFASYLAVDHCVGVANGTDALELALRAVGCQAGDEVITVANAGGYATTAALQVGCRPVFADIRSDTLQVDPDSVASLVGPSTRAIVVTHLYGLMADVESIVAVAKLHDVAVIEDCSQAHGAETVTGKAGSFGDIGCFSFYPSKNLGALGDAGAVVCGDPELALRVRRLAQYGWSNRFEAQIPFGRNSRLDPIQAAILRTKLSYLDQWNLRRKAIVKRFQGSADDRWAFAAQPDSPAYVAHLCVVQCDERTVVRESLRHAGIATGVHYPVADHRQQSLSGIEWRSGDLSATEAAQKRILTLPCFPEMTADEVEHVATQLVAPKR